MSFTVKIAQHDTPVTVEIGQTILEAALAEGVPYPHGCRSGNCGACKSRLIAGDVDAGLISNTSLGMATWSATASVSELEIEPMMAPIPTRSIRRL